MSLQVLVLPISGGYFPKQLGMLLSLLEIGYKPNVSLGNSGGNLVAYLAALSDWKPDQTLLTASKLRSDAYIKPWSVVPIAQVLGFFKGAKYNTSTKALDLFKSLLADRTITDEIWTLTTNMNCSKPQLYSSTTPETSVFGPDIDTKSTGSLPPIYLNSDTEKLGLVSLASASVPTMVPDVKIDGIPYSDGGTSFASPATILSDSLRQFTCRASQGNTVGASGEGLQMTYISSTNIDQDHCNFNMTPGNTITKTRTILSRLIKSLAFLDRKVLIDLIKCCAPDHKTYETEGFVGPDTVAQIESLRKNTLTSLVEYYPNFDDPIDYTKFNGDDVLKLALRTQQDYSYRIWWSGSADTFSSLHHSRVVHHSQHLEQVRSRTHSVVHHSQHLELRAIEATIILSDCFFRKRKTLNVEKVDPW